MSRVTKRDEKIKKQAYKRQYRNSFNSKQKQREQIEMVCFKKEVYKDSNISKGIAC